MLREALKISSPLALVSGEVPRFHGGSLWHSTPGGFLPRRVSARRGGVCPGVSARREVYTPCGQTDICENITFPQLLLRTVNILV